MTRLSIQSVDWATTLEAGEWGIPHAVPSHALTCTLNEWPGYEAVDQFSKVADPVFFLEAAGHRAIEARMAKGGISGLDGSWGATVLVVQSGLEPGVGYHLRPRHENSAYCWLVASDVAVFAE